MVGKEKRRQVTSSITALREMEEEMEQFFSESMDNAAFNERKYKANPDSAEAFSYVGLTNLFLRMAIISRSVQKLSLIAETQESQVHAMKLFIEKNMPKDKEFYEMKAKLEKIETDAVPALLEISKRLKEAIAREKRAQAMNGIA